jgi:hypothetical protein
MKHKLAIMGLGLAILSSAAAGQEKPWERDWKGEPPNYYFNTGDGSFWVFEKDIRREGGGAVSFWLHGEHSKNAKVRYRTSLWHVRLDCSGAYSIDAETTFKPDGSVLDSWDGVGSRSLIRPGTMYQQLEAKLCGPRASERG